MIGRIGPELSFQSYSGIRSVLFTILSLLYIQKFSRVHLHSRIIGTYIKFYTCLIIKKFCHSNQFPGQSSSPPWFPITPCKDAGEVKS